MKKRYLDELREWVRDSSEPRRSSSYHYYLAVKKNVFEAIDDGFPLKTIWSHMHQKKMYPYSYQSMRVHLNRDLKAKKKIPEMVEKPVLSTPEKEAKPEEPKPHEPIISKSTQSKGFVFDPIPKTDEIF